MGVIIVIGYRYWHPGPIITSCMIMSSLLSNDLKSEAPTKQQWEGTANVHYQCAAPVGCCHLNEDQI